MVDIHSQVFFGQTTGIIVKSPSKEEPYIFVQCIRKKPDGVWEKPTNGEGKSVRLSLEEIIMALGVLNGKTEKWTTVHEYQGAKSHLGRLYVPDDLDSIGSSDYPLMRGMLNY